MKPTGAPEGWWVHACCDVATPRVQLVRDIADAGRDVGIAPEAVAALLDRLDTLKLLPSAEVEVDTPPP